MRFYINEKVFTLIFRILSLIMLFSFLIYTKKDITPSHLNYILILFFIYFSFNIIILLINPEKFRKKKINFLIFIVDVILISIAIYFIKGFDSDIYLIYFLVIFLAIINGQGLYSSLLIGFIACLVYLGLYLKDNPVSSLLDSDILLRIPFFFFISFMSSYNYESVKLLEGEIEKKSIRLEKLLLLGETFGGLIHQIKNPLNSIYFTSQLINMEENPSEIKKYTDELTSKVKEILSLVEDVQNFLTNKNAKNTFYDINTLIDETLQFLQDQLRIDGIKIIKIYENKIPPAQVSAELIKFAFMNIINNARESLINSGKKEKFLKIETANNNQTIKIKFSDNGTGITENIIDKIFSGTFTTKTNSSGSGLKITKNIIESYFGNIKVLPNEYNGATFIITLPYNYK